MLQTRDSASMAAIGSSAPGRDVWARRALADVAKMLTLQDRSPHSPTYGCFDRNHWHYKIIDFPSGMAQEFVWPLALAAATDLPDNPYRRSAALRDWVEAGLDFARRSSHPDGSCDDYFPYERATGAAAFSLLAGLESYRLMELERPDLLAFFERRAGWLAGHRESGRLSNHEALVVACLIRLSDLTGTDRWNGAIRDRLDRLLSWQTGEGWFREYEGCDPGYLTLTVGLLAMIDRWRPGLALQGPLDRAVRFAAELMHPDGSYGGEYASRNTHNYFPHGFEMVGDRLPEALAMNDRHRGALEAGRGPCYADDHILGHHAWSYLLAWREHRPERPAPRAEPEGRRWFPEAGLLVERRGGLALFAGLNKGGAFTLFRDGALAVSDTQVSLRVAQKGAQKGGTRTAVAHLVDRYPVTLDEDAVAVSGGFGWAKHTQMTVFRMVLLRVVMTTAGRFFPNLIRRMLQAMLIAGRKPAPFRFRRSFRWEGAELVVEDRVEGDDGWRAVESAGLGGHQTSIYVVMSRVFTPAQLQPWRDLTPLVKDLEDGQPLTLVRRF